MNTRREFLMAAGALAVGSQMEGATADPAIALYERPMRWAQLTLVEDDPGKYDLSFWLDYMKRTHSDATCLSAGGCVAFYPTKIPLHYRSQWMGNSDPFGDLVAVKGDPLTDIRVLERVDAVMKEGKLVR